MKFNIVIGNPPYNNDLYISLILSIHLISYDYMSFITPAKWQAKGGILNDRFREEIVPYMRDIVFYRDSMDIFDIQEWGGITYYLIDNKIHESKRVKNICKRNKVFESEFEEHTELELSLYNKRIQKIIDKVVIKHESLADGISLSRQIYVSEQDRGESEKKQGYVDVMQGELVVGYKSIYDLYTQVNINKYKCVTAIIAGSVNQFDTDNKVLGMFKISILKPYQVPKGSFPVLKYFDTEQECLSFISYMNTRVNAFLFFIGCCGISLTKEFFRYIPHQDNWDIIYEDIPIEGYIIENDDGEYIDREGKRHCSLYHKYKLDEDDIKLIESVIKLRKG